MKLLCWLSESIPPIIETNDPVTLGYGNRDAKVAGKTTFSEGSWSLKDFIDADTEKIIIAWRRMVYNPQTEQIGWASDYRPSFSKL